MIEMIVEMTGKRKLEKRKEKEKEVININNFYPN